MSGRRQDAIKDTLAAFVAGRIKDEELELLAAIAETTGEVLELEVSAVDPLNTQVRVKTVRRGVRCFTVKVTEHW